MVAACAGLVLLPALHAEVGQRAVAAVVGARNEHACAAALHTGAVAWPAAASLAALLQPLAQRHTHLWVETSGATSESGSLFTCLGTGAASPSGRGQLCTSQLQGSWSGYTDLRSAYSSARGRLRSAQWCCSSSSTVVACLSLHAAWQSSSF